MGGKIEDPCPPDKRRFFNWLASPLGKMAQDLNINTPAGGAASAYNGGGAILR
jgi:hypothetical protein